MKNFLLNTFKLTSFIILASTSMSVAGTNIYETESDAKSFSAKVKVIRQNQGETEVAFASDSVSGFYILPDGDKKAEFEAMLEKSKKPNGPEVSISADANKQITGVSIKEK